MSNLMVRSWAPVLTLDGYGVGRVERGTYRYTLDHDEQMKATSLRQFVAYVTNTWPIDPHALSGLLMSRLSQLKDR